MTVQQPTLESTINLKFTLEHIFVACSLVLYSYLAVTFFFSNMTFLEIVMGFFVGQIVLFLLMMIHGIILSLFTHRTPSRSARIKALVRR